MKLHLKSAIAGAAALAIVGAGLAIAAPANAVAPPWSPDSNSLGHLVFYDASGNVLTGGNDLTHFAAYVAVDGAKTAPTANKATLYFATPKVATPTGAWAQAQASASTNFPNATAPAPITGPGFANPLVTVGASDGNLLTYTQSYPNTETAAGYVNVYQVRVSNSGPAGVTSLPSYWESDILVNTTTGVWSLIDPTVATTSTSISATPTSPQVTGASVTLSSTVTPAANGTVSFYDGATQVGAAQAVTTSSATASVSAGTPAIGTHSYTATFTPTGGTQVQGSTSSALSYVITAPVISTTTALSVNPGSVSQYGAATLTANITASDSLAAGQDGSVQFFAGATSLGSATTNDGTVGEYALTIPSVTLPSATYQLHAVFTPSNNAYGTSTSADVPLIVTAPTCAGTPVAGESCTDTQNIQATVVPGSLTITTPYTAANPFVLPNMVLSSDGTQLSTSAQFPAAADNPIVVADTMAGNQNWTVSVTATDLTAGPGATINGANLGLTGGSLVVSPTFTHAVNFTDIPAGQGVAAAASSALGLKGGPHTFAQSVGGGNGSASMRGLLTLTAPSETVAGVYNGTVTFSVA